MKTIRVDPLTRVEGHGRVELQLRNGRLTGVRVAVTESPRLFEGLLLGRSFVEVPALVCRICAICSGVHRIAAATAIEGALGAEIPPAARLVRELLLLGGHIESHALHLFCLVLPDLEGSESVLELLRAGNRNAREGLALKQFGNHLQEVAGGRVIHPVNVEVGGVVRLPDRGKLEGVLAAAQEWTGRLEELLEPFARAGSYPSAAAAVGIRLSVAHPRGLSLTGDVLALSDGRRVAGGDYARLLAERAVPYSNAKHSREESAPFLAGALARLENAGREGEFAAGIHGNNAAQGAELHWALGEVRRLAAELLALDASEPVAVEVRPGPGAGTCVIEAPRGLLVHHYALDDLGRVAAADIVTPTAINQAAMEAQLLADLAGVEGEDVLRERAGRIVRAFDPCISCSVHLIRG